MRLTRRRFLAALAALPFADKALELVEQLAPTGPIRLRKVTGRIEITEEVRRKLEPKRGAFLEWAESEFPAMREQLERELAAHQGIREDVLVNQFGRPIELGSIDADWRQLPELPDNGGRYFEIPTGLVQTSARSSE